MTVDELIDWLASAKRRAEESGQTIGGYSLYIINPHTGRLDEAKVDHGRNCVELVVHQ